MTLPYNKWLANGEAIMAVYTNDKKKVVWSWYNPSEEKNKRSVDVLKNDIIVIPK